VIRILENRAGFSVEEGILKYLFKKEAIVNSFYSLR
jgi:hypothetical protein